MTEHDLKAALSDGAYEITDEGLFLPRQKIVARGRFCFHKRGEPEEFSDNRMVDQGLDRMLGSALYNVTQIPTWYIALFGGNVVVQGSWTAATFSASATELTGYVSATRPAWTPTAPSGGVISSFTAKTSFEANASLTVRGAALLSSATKGSTSPSDVLMAASRFGSDKALESGEILDVGYQIELTPA